MHILNQKTISSALASKETQLVLFYAEWCPYCRRFLPIFDLYESKTKIAFAKAKLEGDEDEMWDTYKINYIPTLIAFKSGKIIARADAPAGVGLDENELKSLIKKIEN